ARTEPDRTRGQADLLVQAYQLAACRLVVAPPVRDRGEPVHRLAVTRIGLQRALELDLGRGIVAEAFVAQAGIRQRPRLVAVIGVARRQLEPFESVLLAPLGA